MEMNMITLAYNRRRAATLGLLLATGVGTMGGIGTATHAAESTSPRTQLTAETFENNFVPPNNTRVCPVPLSATSPTNACFPQGGLVSGVTYSTQNSTGAQGGALIAVGPDFRSASGATDFLSTGNSNAELQDALVMDFAPVDIDTVEFQVISARRNEKCKVQVKYLDGGPDGEVLQDCGRLGFTKSVVQIKGARKIDKITVSNTAGRSEGVDDVKFSTSFAPGQEVPNQFRFKSVDVDNKGQGVANVQVGAAAEVSVRGRGVRPVVVETVGPQKLGFDIRLTGSAAKRLKSTGKYTTTLVLRCTPDGGKTKRVTKKVTLRVKR
jgi:hypothetical protein